MQCCIYCTAAPRWCITFQQKAQRRCGFMCSVAPRAGVCWRKMGRPIRGRHLGLQISKPQRFDLVILAGHLLEVRDPIKLRSDPFHPPAGQSTVLLEPDKRAALERVLNVQPLVGSLPSHVLQLCGTPARPVPHHAFQ
jgi:hypothetical protein